MRLLVLVAPIALLSGCGPAPTDPGPGGVTVAEAQALNEAAEMVDVNAADAADEGQNAQ
ncbi:hypothetical protein NYR55_12800 [Sphingomonas sp. BGYR3]|uniref:hypothetical protein n=1 Tax=Sphingomonas sp. BGYR3 TaxID=2975483 RepID=UPI0021A5D0E2|nr:hypothetical protein [Sphingomonas sp. BGYR3]MDG5489496.1 hypothetical protein [Sphingomonas sp. BGYR3]